MTESLFDLMARRYDPKMQELVDIERKIERVAKAICRSLGQTEDKWVRYYREAEAAVEALSEVKK